MTVAKASNLIPLLCGLACVACDEEGASNGSSNRAFPFPEGDFQFTTTHIEDGCLDGTLNLLFVPHGLETPWDWVYSIKLYPPEALPQTYGIRLRDPFGEMNVRVEQIDALNERAVGVQNEGVLLNQTLYGDCVADLDADVAIELLGEDRGRARAALIMSNPRGAEGRCPDSDRLDAGCQVLLTLDVHRVQPGG